MRNTKKLSGNAEQHEAIANVAYCNSKKHTAHIPHQNEHDKIRDIKFKQARELYHKKVLTLKQYQELIIDVYEFIPQKST